MLREESRSGEVLVCAVCRLDPACAPTERLLGSHVLHLECWEHCNLLRCPVCGKAVVGHRRGEHVWSASKGEQAVVARVASAQLLFKRLVCLRQFHYRSLLDSRCGFEARYSPLEVLEPKKLDAAKAGLSTRLEQMESICPVLKSIFPPPDVDMRVRESVAGSPDDIKEQIQSLCKRVSEWSIRDFSPSKHYELLLALLQHPREVVRATMDIRELFKFATHYYNPNA